ncbi:hypothetical protein NQ314_003547 [Rhamnusium bicolor]|uniref:Clip domain-containing protein n=1 Tax=Rhamnusium bicolor TaxID=1586634 RepID=A0AAV8ZNX5_9CUCU|nr:hypothetical protein NQ314_003547 [Rhamnusium bicolor]
MDVFIASFEGVYELGENSTITVHTKCPKTPVNDTDTGTCTLLKDCPWVYSYLTDFQVYQQYFCPINNKFAGVCCPTKIFEP